MKKKMAFFLAIIMTLSVVSTAAFAGTKYVGNSQRGLQLTYCTGNWAKASGSSSTTSVSVTCTTYYDVINNLTGARVKASPAVRSASGKGSAKTANFTCLYWNGTKASAKIGGNSLSTSAGLAY